MMLNYEVGTIIIPFSQKKMDKLKKFHSKQQGTKFNTLKYKELVQVYMRSIKENTVNNTIILTKDIYDKDYIDYPSDLNNSNVNKNVNRND